MTPPIKKEPEDKINNKKKILLNSMKKKIFKRIQIPAVTRVEECTMAEIGVGADMAAGSQADRGNWALLAMTHTISKEQEKKFQSIIKEKFKFKVKKDTMNKKQTSPKRLKNIVKRPLKKEVLLG